MQKFSVELGKIIEEFKLELQKLVPHARISVGHGQLNEKQLEQIENGTAPRIPQGDDFSMAPMLDKEMSKIDVHYQLEANIELLTDILIEEFKLFKRKCYRWNRHDENKQ